MTLGIIALLIRLILAATFGVAGIAKLCDIERARRAIHGFGLPNWAAAPLGVLLPGAELTVAALLIPDVTVLWADLGTIVLLVAFIIGISINLSLGRKPDCNCFGQARSKPIGLSTLARNGVLLAAAGFVLLRLQKGRPVSLLNLIAGFSPIELVAILLGAVTLLVVALGAWVTFHLLRQNGRLLLRMDELERQLVTGAALPVSAQGAAPPGLPIGSPAPHFELPQLDGRSAASLHTLLAERRPVALIFSDPDCGPCTALLPQISRWQQEHAQALTIALVSRGSQQANQAKLGNHILRNVILQKDREVLAAYQANGTPGAILIDGDGRIASALAMGSQAIATLIANSARPGPVALRPQNVNNNGALANQQVALGLAIGSAAPSLRLPDLSGRIVDLENCLLQDTVVLFWNPSCGFCARMLPELTLWEQNSTADLPQLLVVSSGTVEANLAMGLRSTIVLDQDFTAGRAFKVRGTPSAVLVGSDNKIRSGVVSGAQAILEMVSNQRRQTVLEMHG